MSELYKILVVEDDSSGSVIGEYVTTHCNSGLGELKRVDNQDDLIHALRESHWDMILSEYSLPEISAEKVLKIINRSGLDIPVIVVSDKTNEQYVMPILYAGAEHFISKDDMEMLCITVPRSIAISRRRREVGSELEKYRKRLEELVAERTAELEKANAQLKHEVDKRQRIENALRESESQYRNLVENASAGICIIQDQKLNFVNQCLAQMLGYDAELIIGTKFIDYCFSEEHDRIMASYYRIMKGEEDTQSYETSLLNKRGQRVEVHVTTNVIEYHGRRGAMVVIRDITEQKRISRMVRENERLEAVGLVARGVGNNFNNIMNVISSYAVSIADSFLPHTRPYDSARKIMDATRHASALTKRLLSVVEVSETESDKTNLGHVALSDVIKNVGDLVAHSLQAHGIEVVIKKKGPLPFVMADKSQLLDALISIFMNAIEALPDGGEISINVIERTINKPHTNPTAKGGRFVGLSINDNGVGMSKEQIAKVFEPFYTTKTKEKAFGLGLPVAQSMAHSWGGWIDIKSRLGRGTRVRIFMTKAEEQTVVEEDLVTPLKVLVVDDNDGRRKMIVGTLLDQGHQVIEATDGEMAIKLYNQHAAEIDLSIVDWLLPKKDGKSVVKAIMAHDFQSKVIMISGFSKDYVRSEIRMGAWGFLQKPFEKDELLKAIEKERIRDIK